MEGGYNFKQLSVEILRLSKAKEWEAARKEWALVDIMEAEEPETCLCGHHPIIEICEIKNRITGCTAEVGNVCVKRFLGFRSDLIFIGIKKVRKDVRKSLNADSIAFFKQRNLLSDWEYGFLQDTMKKRNLTVKQMDMRIKINRKILSAISRRGFQGSDIQI